MRFATADQLLARLKDYNASLKFPFKVKGLIIYSGEVQLQHYYINYSGYDTSN